MSTSKSAAAAAFLTITALLSLATSSASSQHQIQGTKEFGFSVNLIHRDSPQSPFYNPNLTKSERIKAAVQHTRSRHRYLQSLSNRKITANEPQPRVTSETGEYVLNFSIGTPPVHTYAIADTASELTWLQCLPCQECYKQKIPIFDPSQSWTYEILGCEDNQCSLASDTICNQTTHNCAYSLRYGDDSHSTGDLSLDTLTFSDDGPIGEIKLSNMIIGCGHKNHETTPPETINQPGVIGLNQKAVSFIKQLMIEHFSYCLVLKANYNLSSIMHFQSKAVLFGGKTAILDGESMDEAYYLFLDGISVGTTRLQLPKGFFNMTSSGEGGFMIDSGTTFSLLKPGALNKLIVELTKQIDDKVPESEPWEEFMPCYETTLDVINSVAPDLIFHFGDLDLMLNKESTWMDVGQGTVCLAILSSPFGDMSVFGNFQQQNMNIGFDLENKVVSFMKMDDCNST